MDGRYIGVDGCRGGWIAAVIEDGILSLERYPSLFDLVKANQVFDVFLIDMAIGLRDSVEQIRPEEVARKLLVPRSSTIFPVPARAAVYSENEDEQKKANLEILGKSLTKQSINIIPKIRELDEFLNKYTEYKNVICESHPELCFARLSGRVLLSRKKEITGLYERESILVEYLGTDNVKDLRSMSKNLGCSPDDILDAVCLAVTANLKAEGLCETIPENPQKDSRGLLMQMVVPKER